MEKLNNDGLPLGVREPRSVESSNEVGGLLVHVRRTEPAAAVVVARPDLPRVPLLPLVGCGFLISFSPRPPKAAEAAEGHGRRAPLASHGAIAVYCCLEEDTLRHGAIYRGFGGDRSNDS